MTSRNAPWGTVTLRLNPSKVIYDISHLTNKHYPSEMAGLTKHDFKGQVILYSVQGCTSCAKVKSILAEMGIPFYDIDLGKYAEERKAMFDHTGSRVVPQLFFNDKHVGGYHELKKLLVSG